MTIGRPARVLWWLSGVLIVSVALLIGNFIVAQRYLLRVDWSRNPLDGIERRMAPVASPLVLAMSDRAVDAPALPRLVAAIGPTWRSLPVTDERLVPIDRVARMNPYPQPFDVVRGRDVNYVSFGYVGIDDRYHQVTHYWGEADTTPSWLVRKVRGPRTGWGDYFVRYTIFLSRDLKPRPAITDAATGVVQRWEPPPTTPDVDRIDWS